MKTTDFDIPENHFIPDGGKTDFSQIACNKIYISRFNWPSQDQKLSIQF